MKELLQMALDALRHSIPSRRPGEDAYCERGWSEHKAAITALREALAAPQAEPVAWAMLRADGLVLDVICPDEGDAYQGEYTVPLYAAPPAAPAPAVPEGDVVVSWNEDGQIVAVTRQDREGRILSVIAESAAPVVRGPLTDEQIHDCFQQRHMNKATQRRMITRAIEAHHGIGGGGK